MTNAAVTAKIELEAQAVRDGLYSLEAATTNLWDVLCDEGYAEFAGEAVEILIAKFN